MTSFHEYSSYYDLFYLDKDYAGEAQYISNLIGRYRPQARTILDLGCGTAAHAAHLAGLGFRVHGIDLSDSMLAGARQRLQGLPLETADRISLSQCDIRLFRSAKRFDAVIALFHVMSYQTENADLLDTFKTAYCHLNPGGIFIFDCWYGPAVLADRPEVRQRRFEDENRLVTRIAEPVLHPNNNVVEVNYHITVKNKHNGTTEQFQESHAMRYLFRPEIALIAAASGLELLASLSWMTEFPPGFDSWYACFICERRKDGSPS
jgi:SAM-dependent methyltransferase